jgi:hypothetical protein
VPLGDEVAAAPEYEVQSQREEAVEAPEVLSESAPAQPAVRESGPGEEAPAEPGGSTATGTSEEGQ